MPGLSRRDLLTLAGGLTLLPNASASAIRAGTAALRIRTITAGVNLTALGEARPLRSALAFLGRARGLFEDAGHEVQTIRVATQPLAETLAATRWTDTLAALRELDVAVGEAGALLSLGPLLAEDRHDPGFAAQAGELAGSTANTSFSVAVGAPGTGAFPRGARTAAEAIQAISRAAPGGEANFRFAAAANVPPGTPFFPVAYHSGSPGFALGLESAGLVTEAFAAVPDLQAAPAKLAALLEQRLAPVAELGRRLAGSTSRRFLGIDLSPAPGLEASIAAAIESLTGAPFGLPSTLAACAAVTRALDQARLTKCGYSGLMLPVLEDRRLARRAGEGRFGVQQLLLYSSVCGTGLDVVPLPGDSGVDRLAALVLDVATLAARLRKPLAARLLPIPDKRAGDPVDFDNPHLTASVVMALG